MVTTKDFNNRFSLQRAAGLVLAGVAFCLLLGSHHDNLLYPPDPVFEISSRVVLWIIGGLAGVIGCVCLLGRERFIASGMVVWLALSLLIYRIALSVLGHGAAGYLSITAADYGLSARTFEGMLVFAFGGAVFLAVASMRCGRATELAGGFKAACPGCGQHIQCKDQDAGREITCPACKKVFALRKEAELKMTCIFCKGHIQFPAHSLGRKMPCPHCRMDITLKEVPESKTFEEPLQTG